MEIEEVLQERERTLRDIATDLRATAERLLRAVEGVWWEGRSGDALRTAARSRADGVRAAADRYDAAAEALAAHGHEVRSWALWT